MRFKIRGMGHALYRITFIVYRPNSEVVSLGSVYDSLDSDLQTQDFSSNEKEQARKWLFDLFLADIKLRQHNDWIRGLQVMAWIDGRALSSCSDDVRCDDMRCDTESLIFQARAAAQEQFDHV
jgi:hypothetical protein